ncbi:MAG: hypothetical protein VX107_08025, partial [Pseudomonadota bacterium]|nr:hypothetical protein [Pseudomonadota bacterium]
RRNAWMDVARRASGVFGTGYIELSFLFPLVVPGRLVEDVSPPGVSYAPFGADRSMSFQFLMGQR